MPDIITINIYVRQLNNYLFYYYYIYIWISMYAYSKYTFNLLLTCSFWQLNPCGQSALLLGIPCLWPLGAPSPEDPTLLVWSGKINIPPSEYILISKAKK